jgi:hypothetical protein
MSDQSNANTVEVPREVADRILMALDQSNAFNCAADLRACIKPRRWVFEDKWAHVSSMGKGIVAFHDHDADLNGMIHVRVIVEEIV